MKLVGLSGCELKLIRPGVVRKCSASVDYNQRLIKQINKQVLFTNFTFKSLSAPKVLNSESGDLVYFDMEYVAGLSATENFLIAGADDIKFVIDTLFSYFDRLSQSARSLDIKERLLVKLKSLQGTSTYSTYIAYLIEQIETKHSIVVPHTFCHGDLTFENMIFQESRLFFIDFLDSFVDSFLVDLVKLKQELVYYWSLKNHSRLLPRVIQSYRPIWSQIAARYRDYVDSEAFMLLDVLNILRIEPYLKTPAQRAILNEIIESMEPYEKFSCADGRRTQRIAGG